MSCTVTKSINKNPTSLKLLNSNQNTKSPQLFWLTETVIVISNTLYNVMNIQLDIDP